MILSKIMKSEYSWANLNDMVPYFYEDKLLEFIPIVKKLEKYNRKAYNILKNISEGKCIECEDIKSINNLLSKIEEYNK